MCNVGGQSGKRRPRPPRVGERGHDGVSLVAEKTYGTVAEGELAPRNAGTSIGTWRNRVRVQVWLPVRKWAGAASRADPLPPNGFGSLTPMTEESRRSHPRWPPSRDIQPAVRRGFPAEASPNRACRGTSVMLNTVNLPSATMTPSGAGQRAAVPRYELRAIAAFTRAGRGRQVCTGM